MRAKHFEKLVKKSIIKHISATKCLSSILKVLEI